MENENGHRAKQKAIIRPMDKNIHIAVTDRHIVWSTGAEQLQKLDLDRVRVIAEYTTPYGPKQDDWFVKLIVSATESYELSMYDSQSETVQEEMRTHFGLSLITSLYGSTDWASQVMYPAEVAGQPLWRISKARQTGVLGWLKAYFFGSQLIFDLTEGLEERINDATQ